MAAPALAPVGNFDPSVPAHRAIPLPRVRRMAAAGHRLALLSPGYFTLNVSKPISPRHGAKPTEQTGWLAP